MCSERDRNEVDTWGMSMRQTVGILRFRRLRFGDRLLGPIAQAEGQRPVDRVGELGDRQQDEKVHGKDDVDEE